MIFISCINYRGEIMNKKQMLKEQKRLKKERRESEHLFNNENDITKNIIITTVSVIAFVLIVFCFVNIAKGNWNLFNKNNIPVESIDNKMVMVGTMFNKSNDEYLVLAYDMNDKNESDYYGALTENYYNPKTLYFLDLSSGFNSKFIGEKEVISSDLTKLKISGPTLFIIKGNTVVKSYTGESSIAKYFEDEK